jgi:hypothetical protein
MRQIAALTSRITKLCDSELSMFSAQRRGNVEHLSGESRFHDRQKRKHAHIENKFRREHVARNRDTLPCFIFATSLRAPCRPAGKIRIICRGKGELLHDFPLFAGQYLEGPQGPDTIEIISPSHRRLKSPRSPSSTLRMVLVRSVYWRSIAVLAAAAPAIARSNDQSFDTQVLPLVKQFCIDCHSGTEPEGDLSLETAAGELHVSEHPEVWEKIVERLRRGEMPPAKEPQPPSQATAVAMEWIEAKLSEIAKQAEPNPGRVTMRRLNRVEYNNTIRDLVGIDFHPADDFPVDDTGYGFDNNGDVLSLPPLLLEKYLTAAEQIVDKAVTENLRGMVAAGIASKDVRLIERFAQRAYRRPIEKDELQRLTQLYQRAEREGASFEVAIKLPLQAILVSPHFLFRAEIDSPQAADESVRQLNAYELASRLSYFLWSSMPDDALFDAARSGRLETDQQLTEQVQRMLTNAKSSAFVANFGGQWLQLQKLDLVSPDSDRFPQFTPELQADMRRETELFFEAVLRENRPLTDLLDADFTFINERLATHYGIPEIKGNKFRRVSIDRSERGGLLTQASVLTLTSNATRTSPVKRGKWILENLLGAPPPPPPPGVPELPEEKHGELVGTLRERLEQHRANNACSSCHSRIDPLGFGLENYDAIGVWRTSDSDGAIDASGTLPDGTSFNGSNELKRMLVSRRDEFTRALGEKMLTYALGRGLTYTDRPSLDRIVAEVRDREYQLKHLVVAVALSDPFRKRAVGETP